MNSARNLIIAALVALLLAFFAYVKWQDSHLRQQQERIGGLTAALDTAVSANRQANATIGRLERSANTTIRVTADWSVRNDTLAAAGRDTAVAIAEVRNDDPDAQDCLDTPLPDALVSSLDRLYGQACAAGGGQCPLSGGDRPAGASAQGQGDTCAPARGVDPKKTGDVVRPAVGDPGQERGR